MISSEPPGSLARLQTIAHRVMPARGLVPDFTPAALAELDAIQAPASTTDPVASSPAWASMSS